MEYPDGKVVSFKAPFRRLPILDAIKEKTGFELDGKSEEEIRDIAVNKLKMEGIDESFGKVSSSTRYSESSARARSSSLHSSPTILSR